MGAARPEGAIRPFSKSGYEILDDGVSRELVIWSIDPTAPRLGDVFLVEREGRTFDAAVAELTRFKGGWSALCRMRPL